MNRITFWMIPLLLVPGVSPAADIAGVVLVRPKLSEAEYQKQMKGLKQDDVYKVQGVQRFDYKTNASAGQILLSDATYHEIKDIFPTRKLDPIRVKNVSEPVQIYEVL